MSFRHRAYKAVLCALAVLLLCGAGQMQRLLNAERVQMGFLGAQQLENAPPVLAFTTVALGGFRGLIANALWMRANDLQDEDKYFEMVQLSDWITKLQPRMVQVWCEQAWNMAYNISVKFKNPEDRWFWVQRGIQLLRDDGLRYNTNSALMYQNLSWIFEHKLGANMDDAHMTYKLHWAQQMQELFPGGQAHTNELLHPPDDAWCQRVKTLRDEYKMDPAMIAHVESEYGPFDWRLPEAHAIYWGELGRIYGAPADQYNIRREIFQSMREDCFIGGALPAAITNITPENFYLRPNLQLIPTINTTYLKMIDDEKDPSQKQTDVNAHKNFLKEAIPMLYLDGDETKSAYWFKYLTNNFTNVFAPTEDDRSLRAFVTKSVEDNYGSGADQNKVGYTLAFLINREFQDLILGQDLTLVRSLENKIYEHYKLASAGTGSRLILPDLDELRRQILAALLNPDESYLPPLYQAILRDKLGLTAQETVAAPTNMYSGNTNALQFQTNGPRRSTPIGR